MSDLDSASVGAADSVPLKPGAVLAAARKAQNLEVADVARQLKLSASQVIALEEGAHDRLPGPVFVRGFIRNYARLLKVDASTLLVSPVVVATEPIQPAASQEIAFAPGAPRRWPRVAGAVFATLVVALAIYEFGFDDSRPTAPAAAVQTVPPQPVVVETPAPAAVEAQPAAPATAVPPAAAPEPAKAVEKPAAALPNYDKTTKLGEARVSMVFERDAWVEIRDRSGRTLLSQLNPGGSEQQVNGVPPLSVVVGNARAVRLMYNDRPVNLAPHVKVDVARLTLE